MAFLRAAWLVAAASMVVAQQGQAQDSGSRPEILVVVEDFTPEGKPREFSSQEGKLTWSPGSPVPKGDRLQVSFSMTGGIPVSNIRVRLDGQPYAYLTKPPWKVIIDTSRLSSGEHVLQGEIRSKTDVIRYGFATLKFDVRDLPETQVKGSVQELIGDNVTSVTPSPTIDPTIVVKVRSENPGVDKLIGEERTIVIDSPVRLYVEADVDLWAYSVTRGGLEVVSGGPMAKRVHLELAPKTGVEPGLLPGNLTLRVWGVKSATSYSEPVEVNLLVK